MLALAGGTSILVCCDCAQKILRINSFFTSHKHDKRRGWGVVRVSVVVGRIEWQTSVFPSKDINAYLLQIKLAVRKKEQFGEVDHVDINLSVKV